MIVLYYDPQDYRERGYEDLNNLYHCVYKIAAKENNNQHVILMPKHLELRELKNNELVSWYCELKSIIKAVEEEMIIDGRA